MSEVVIFREGGYRYIKAVFQYSSGVAAEPGFEIERARLAKPLPLAAGFAAIEAHLGALGFSWKDAVSTQAYSVRDIGALVGPEIAARGAAVGGLSWHFARPPVVGLEYEMDVRGTARELLI